MDITNLKEGQTIKNYKAMCEILQEEIKTGGGAKQSQLKDWERYFSYHKEGHKFIIDEVYKEPKEKMDNRKGHSGKSKGSRKQNSVYSKYIKILILHILAEKYKQKHKKLYISKGEMLQELDMVNLNFQYANYNRDKLANYLKIDIKFINDFFNLNYQNLNNSIITALNSLQNMDNLIVYKIVTTVIRPTKTTTATEAEDRLIKNTEYEVMESMGYNNMCGVHLNDLYKEFRKQVIKKLNKKGIIGYYKSYDIVFSDYILEAKERTDNYLLEKDEVNTNKQELNKTVCTKLNINAENRHSKAKKKYDSIFGTTKDEKIKLQSNQDYLQNNKRIIDFVIDVEEDEAITDMEKKWEERQTKEEIYINQQLEAIFG
ncbi:hypothetical protein Z962_11375 [Clostridium botulinum C/D str. BKT12695]|nr:hypothetical protein Z962_11375 [Clostridium botulinum C/D str. BKT12695]